MGSITTSTGTVFYSLLYLNSRQGFNWLKYMYSVISVIVDSLPGNTKNRESTHSWTARVRLFHPWADILTTCCYIYICIYMSLESPESLEWERLELLWLEWLASQHVAMYTHNTLLYIHMFIYVTGVTRGARVRATRVVVTRVARSTIYIHMYIYVTRATRVARVTFRVSDSSCCDSSDSIASRHNTLLCILTIRYYIYICLYMSPECLESLECHLKRLQWPERLE